MFAEAITIGTIIGGSAIAVWFAKSKFQPEIERNLAGIESSAGVEVEHIRKGL